MTEVTQRLTTALVDRYQIEREIGAGGMATVYLARDVKHGRRVALKVLRPELSAILGSERFLAEIKTTANLQHPHILSLFDSGEAQGHVFYVMPYVEGESLRDRLRREHQLPVDDAVRITREVAEALEYAHRHGIVHRDIKPENILLHDGHALVADFGIALAAARSEGGTRITETGMSLGTPHYMAPEQAMGEREITPKADIYALGCVLYEMLVAEPPFTGPTAQAIIARVMTEEPRSLTLQRKTIPPHLEEAVGRALSKLPADRYKSAEEFAQALVATGPGRAVPARALRPTPRALPMRTLGMIVGGTVLATALVTALVLRAGSGGRDRAVKRLRLELPELTAVALQTSGRNVGVAPDGASIAYVGSAADGSSHIFVRRWDALDATMVPGSEGGWDPNFSPSGDSLAFVLSPHRVKVVPLTGGVPVIVADSGLYGFSDGINGLDWGRDGALYVTAQSGVGRVRPGENRLVRVSQLDSARGDFAHLFPSLLPNGKGVLVTVAFDALFGNRPDSLVVGVVDLATGKTTALLRGIRPQYASSGHIVYVRSDGVLMAAPFDQARLRVTGPAIALRDTAMLKAPGSSTSADFALSREGTLVYTKLAPFTYSATWVDRAGKTTPLRPDLGSRHQGLTISPDGSGVAMAIDDDMWFVPFGKAPPLRLTTGGIAGTGRVAWTPDGHTLYVVGYREGRFSTVLRVPVRDGGQAEEVAVHDSRQMFGTAISPDGAWLLFRTDNQASGAGDILGLRLGIDTVPRVFVASQFEEVSPAISPDGRWMAYSSNESGRHEIYVRPFPETNAAKFQVSFDGGIEPRWSKNGRELFYRSARDKLVSVPVIPGPTFARGAPVDLLDVSAFEASTYSQSYDVSADGKRFLMLRVVGDPRPEAVVVFNFLEELKAAFRRGGR